MSLDAAPFMQRAFRFQVRLVSFFGCFEVAKESAPSTWKANLCQPLAWTVLARGIQRNAKESRFVVALGSALVLFVDGRRHASQVGPAIVRLVAVDVVYLATGPFACHVEPSEAVGVVLPSHVHPNPYVPVGCLATSQRAHRRTLAPAAPAEFSRERVVGKKLAQTLRANIERSHEALRLLIGQRPRRVSSTSRLRYFGLYGNTVQAMEA